jgi:hypothetical protein
VANDPAGQTLVSQAITTSGFPVQISISGNMYVGSIPAAGFRGTEVQVYRNGTAIGTPVEVGATEVNQRVIFSTTITDSPSSGVNTYTVRQNIDSIAARNYDFVRISLVELQGATGATGPTGPISPTTFLPMQTGGFYISTLNATTVSNPTANTFIATPIFISTALTAVSLNIRTVTHTTNGVARLGIYNMASTGRPGSLLLDAGTISYTASAQTHTVTISQALAVGWYFFGMVVQSGSSTWQGYASGANIGAQNTQRVLSVSSTNSITCYTTTGVTGALPSTPTWTPDNANGLMVRVGF